MTSPRLTISLQGPATESLGLLQIEQQEWSAYVGVVTSGAMVRALRTMLYGDEYQDKLDCGLVNGHVVCVIDVYPRIQDLEYQFAASWGILSNRSEQEVVETELVSFRLSSTATPAHPAFAILSAKWVDNLVYDAAGNERKAPALIIDGNTIATADGSTIYGTAEVRYRTERHSYILTIPRRDDAVDNFYSAAVYGWYKGGIEWLIIKMPPGIETFEADPDAVCGHSVTASVTDDEPDPYEQPVTASRTSIVDYCSQVVVEDSYV